MAVLKIVDFGGLRPKDSARALPDNGAQTASNLDADTAEFRPLAADTTVVANSGASNPLSLYRFQRNADGSLNTTMTASWLASAADKNFVKAQLNDDATDRTYVSFNDGSAPPRMVDATGMDRRLGVPAPTTAPTVTVNTTDEFTTDERGTELGAALQTAITAVKSSATLVWRGAAHPGTGTTGYLDRSTTYGFGTVDDSQQVRAYRLASTGGAISDSYCSVDATNFSWVMDPQLAPFTGPAGASPAWAGGAGTPHVCLAFTAYGQTYDINSSAITTALAAIAMPGKSDGTKLFTSGQVADLVDEIEDYLDPAGDQLKPKLDALASKVTEIHQLLDGGSRSSLSAMTQAFYSKTDVAAEITAAIANFALNVFQAADGVARSSLPADYLGPSGDNSA